MLVGNSKFGEHSDLIGVLRAFGKALLGSYRKTKILAFAINIELKGFAAGIANEIDELIPILNFLAIDGANEVAIAESGAVGRSANGDFTDDRRDGRVAEGTLVRIATGGEIDFAGAPVIGDQELESAAGSGLHGNFLSIFPRGVLDAIDGKKCVT